MIRKLVKLGCIVVLAIIVADCSKSEIGEEPVPEIVTPEEGGNDNPDNPSEAEDIVPLLQPLNFTCSQQGVTVTISWDPVPNAHAYEFVLFDSAHQVLESAEVDEAGVTFAELPVGSYCLSVVAKSKNEKFSSSEPIRFEFERVRFLTGRVPGKYTTHWGDKRNVQISQYDDGVLAVESFCGIEGFNLEIMIDEDCSICVLNYYDQQDGYKRVATGMEQPQYVAISENSQQTKYSETSKGKIVNFYSRFGDNDEGGYDTLKWAAPDYTEAMANLLGEYEMTQFSGSVWYWYATPRLTVWYDFDNEFKHDVIINRVDDETVEICGLLGIGITKYCSSFTDFDCVYAYPDFEASSLCINAQHTHHKDTKILNEYFGICAYNEANEMSGDVTASFSGQGVITIDNWSPWYTYCTIAGAHTVLVKK